MLDLTDRLLAKTQFAQFPFLPSYWLSSTLTNWVDGARTLAQFFIGVLTANVLFFGFLGFTSTGKTFYQSLSATLSRAVGRGLSQAVSFALGCARKSSCSRGSCLWSISVASISGTANSRLWPKPMRPEKSPDIASIDLGRWTTNKVAQLEPRLVQDGLYALKPSLRLLYERSASGEMQQLGPDLEYLINANLRSTLSGLDLVRAATIYEARQRSLPPNRSRC